MNRNPPFPRYSYGLLILWLVLTVNTSHCDAEFLENSTSLASIFIEVYFQLVVTRAGHVQGVQSQLEVVLILSLVSDGDMGPVDAGPETITTQIAADKQWLRISIIIDSVQVYLSHTLLQSTVSSIVVLQASIKFHTALFFPLQVCGASAFLAGWLIRTGLELRAACGMLIC